MVPILEKEVEDKETTSNYRFIKRHLTLAKLIQPIWAENVNVTGIENLISEGSPIKGPFLFVLNHRGYFDVPDLWPVWDKLPDPPTVYAVGRDNYTGNFLLDSVFNWYISPLIKTIKRITTEKLNDVNGINRKFNDDKINLLHELMEEGHSTAIFPEGTSKHNGAIKLKKEGVWKLASKRVENNIEYTVKCIPIGNTIDLLGGRRKRHISYVNIGEIFNYEKTSEDESVDRNNFSKYIGDRLNELQTFTVSQLGGIYLRDKINNNWGVFTKEDLFRFINEAYDDLEKIDDGRPLNFDYKLLNIKREKQIDKFFYNLQKRKYLESEQGICLIDYDKFNTSPSGNYKKKNPLRYMVNSLLSVAQNRPSVMRSLERSLKNEKLSSIEII